MNHRVLFLRGINNQSEAKVSIDKKGDFKLAFDGCCNTFESLKDDRCEFEMLVLSPDQGQVNFEIKKPAVIFNEISDPDSHSLVLKKAKKIRGHFSEIPFINDPANVEQSSREQVSKKLADILDVVTPKTIRTRLNSSEKFKSKWESQFNGPILLRRAGFHGGKSTVLFRNSEDLCKLEAVALDGGEFYMTEYVDFKSSDGLFRKYRIVMVDGKSYLRHVIASDNWLVHAASRSFMTKNPLLVDQEVAEFDNFEDQLRRQIANRCQILSERMGLDYFGIDCSFIDDGSLLIFEANANMNVLVNNQSRPNIWESPIERIKMALKELIHRKIN